MNAPLVEARELTFRYGAVPALDAVSAAIRPGLVTGLVGPDGAGKTTFIRILAGLLDASGGGVTVLGLDPAAQSGPLHERIGYMLFWFRVISNCHCADSGWPIARLPVWDKYCIYRRQLVRLLRHLSIATNNHWL